MAQPPVSPKEKWEARYRAGDFEPNREPVPFLSAEARELEPGRALCLAAGAGRNAVFLAELGFEVTAVDIAPAGLAWCRRLASERGVAVETIAADVLSFDAGVERWDLVTNLYFHEPAVFPRVRSALRSGGHFLFQTYQAVEKPPFAALPNRSARSRRRGMRTLRFPTQARRPSAARRHRPKAARSASIPARRPDRNSRRPLGVPQPVSFRMAKPRLKALP